jgi:predicted unusual protein kinase regulating ubiquinone biosynthesis (AarF/ABC1/UbiB family)
MSLTARLSRYRAFAEMLLKYRSLADDQDGVAPDADEDRAVQFARDLEALGPTFIKLGQLLSSRADLLPARYIEALERLQDDVAPFPGAEAIRIVEEELGVRLSKIFSRFDETPIAAASFGQVHRAWLRDGREVAVKVQRPDVRERVREDLDALGELADLLTRTGLVPDSLDVGQTLDEFRRSIASELDYRQEARHMTRIAHALRDFESVVIPLPIDDFTAGRVLTMDYIEGTKITRVADVEWTEVDGEALCDALCRAYLQQVLVDGFFHADPHAGNVLLTTDHRLALIDLGMVGRLSPAIQERLFRLLLAISDGRGDEAADVLITLGDRLETFDEGRVRRMVTDLVGRTRHVTAEELQIGRVMLDLARSGGRCGLRLAPELALLGKTLLQLDEIGRLLDPHVDVNGSLRRNAVEVMRKRALKDLTPSHLFSSALELRDLASALPARVNRILDALARNDLRLKVEVIDHGIIIDGLQKVANRIALALVLAALIVGAAMLMQVPTPFSILGYPGLAMLLFLGAAAGGLWMAYSILMSDVRRKVR